MPFLFSCYKNAKENLFQFQFQFQKFFFNAFLLLQKKKKQLMRYNGVLGKPKMFNTLALSPSLKKNAQCFKLLHAFEYNLAKPLWWKYLFNVFCNNNNWFLSYWFTLPDDSLFIIFPFAIGFCFLFWNVFRFGQIWLFGTFNVCFFCFFL